MTQSTITSKFQTTVPKEVREKLGLKPQDVLCWEVSGKDIRVIPARRSFLDRRGSFQVGPGSVVDDIRHARETREAE
ncbi:MAG: AbrB/MazE/SpoVT family DNA-binding domain-containing protein [Acidobacteriota bacterium]